MKTKYYTKLLFPLCLFCFIFRVLELAFSVEFSVDSYFYADGSIIPVMFNIYIALCLIFLLSFWFISLFNDIHSSELRDKKAERKAARAAGPEAYKAYVEAEKKNIIPQSDFSQVKKLDGKSIFFYITASIFLLTYSAQLLLTEIDNNAVTYTSFTDIFATLVPYIFIAALLSVLFFVQFAASPKAAAKGKFWRIIAVMPAIFYTLLVFYTFRVHLGIVSKVFVAYDFIKIAALAIALICLPQLMISSQRKPLFFSASLCAVFLSTLRLADSFVSLLVTIGAENLLLPLSHLNGLDGNHLLIVGDFLLSLALLLTATRLYKKPRKKKDEIPEVPVAQETTGKVEQ